MTTSLTHVLQGFRMDPVISQGVTAWQPLPARQARTAPFPDGLDPRLIAALARRDIHCLYTHQAQATDAALRGENVAIVTPTASGKTLCYNLPILHALLNEPNARALYLFPTKALSQDQLAELGDFLEHLEESALPPALAAIYDGDTPKSRRKSIREGARLIITNPDMLHTGILPHHTLWADLFSNLRYVVLDELHTYRGVFGSHVANVLRRLRRICQFYGSSPQFICASATIANPQEHAERLLETSVTLVDDNGAPMGEKHFILYNPPMVDQRLGIRRSAILEAQRLATEFIANGVQTIVFARARRTMEVLLTYLRDTVKERQINPEAIRGYRGGYLAEQRREIEAGLRSGEVRGVVATNALELGIDIGQLGAAVLTGYPGTIASTWQQAGRAGRRAGISVAILVASAAPLDQYLATHPRYFLERTPEQALVNPDNPLILLDHLRCAAFELPFVAEEGFGLLEDVERYLKFLAEEEVIKRVGPTWYWLAEGYPAESVSLRSAGAENVVIQDVGASPPLAIGEVDHFSAPSLVHKGAIYIHEGQTYQVETFDWEAGRADVRPVSVDYYTEATGSTRIRVLDLFEEADEGKTHRSHGEVAAISQVTGYKVVKRYTHEVLSWEDLTLPEQEMHTTGYWLHLPQKVVEQLRAAGVWFGDSQDYGPNWTAQRDQVRERDEFRCRKCSAPETSGRPHHVHHLRPFRSFGYIPGVNEAYIEANALDNLLTLCPTCHQRAESPHRERSALAGLAYILGQIAPLYLMCDPRDIGSAVEARSNFTGLPTITLYDQVPAGIGLAERLYEMHGDLLVAARELVRACGCYIGCPGCVGPVIESDLDAKRLTMTLLEDILPCR